MEEQLMKSSRSALSMTSKVCAVDGIIVNVRSVDHALSAIGSLVEDGRSFFLCTLNLDHLAKLHSDRAFRTVYEEASLVTLDSTPLVWLKRLMGAKVDRAAGADLMRPVCALAVKKKLGVFLIGPSVEVNERFERQVTAEMGRFHDFHALVPSRNFSPHGAEADEVVRKVCESKAILCFIALGAPKQEFLASRIAKVSERVACIPIGAAVEFMAGTKRRAPQWMQRCGLEWLWRLSREPRRLGRRYLASFFALVSLIGQELRTYLANA